ncbi:MAG: flagellin [bacterium]|nr:flagellin [bacterium]
MIINHNISAIFASRMLKMNGISIDKNIEKLSSGMRINRAGDDASGLAVSEKMRSQIRGLRQAARNLEDGISFVQTTEGYLQEGQDVLQRMRELAIQSANGIYTKEDRMQIQVEVSSLMSELDRVATSAQFNGMNMLTGRFANPQAGGTATGSMWFHIGANAGQRVRAFIGTMSVAGLNVQGISISTPESAQSSLAKIDTALTKISKQRADLGAYQSRFEMGVKGVLTGYENLQASESRIRDVDMAEEMVDYTKNQILLQSTTAMLAQANMKTASILPLLG